MLRVLAFLLIALTAGAADRPTLPAFRNQLAGAEPAPLDQWWKGFHDPLLDRLIDRASRNNLEARKAAARLAEADALRRGSRAALLPDLAGNASATQLRGGFSQGVVRAPGGGSGGGSFVSPFETSLISGGLSLRWEIDVFRGLSKSLKAAGADASAAAEQARDVQAIVRAEVARTYVELRAAEDQVAIVRATAQAEEELLGLIRSRAEAGLASDLDVERQTAQLATIRAELPELDSRRLQAAHRIGVLLGETPSALLRELEPAGTELAIPNAPLAIPSDVLRRRPDLRRAEAQIAAAYARAGAARSDLYPKIVITGLSGRQATDVQGLTIGAGNFFSVGPGISLPIFNFGRIRSQIAARDAQVEQALRSYEQDILGAFEETENALVQRDRAELRRSELQTGLAAADRSVALSTELYVRGLGDFLAVLDAQRQRFAIERDLAASRAAVLRATVALYRALGG